MKKRIITVVAFLLAAALSLGGIRHILYFKYGDGILGLQNLYREKDDSIDLLVLGSSHAFEDVNTAALYEDYGIAAYVLAGSYQPMWNTYYYLKEALKTQHPKMILIEGYCTSQEFEYSDNSGIIKNNLGIRDPENRLASLKVSAPAENRQDYIQDFRLWHSRYEEIDASDFSAYYETPKMKYYKGFGVNYETQEQVRPDLDSFSPDPIPLYEKEEKYFRKVLDLCRDAGIPAMVVISPYAVNEIEQRRFLTTGRICGEYQVPYLNFNSDALYDDMNLDFRTDFADAAHLNDLGNEKYTALLGKRLTEQVDFPDRRDDAGYESWARHSRDISDRTRDHVLAEETDVEKLISGIKAGKDLSVYIVSYTESQDIEKNTGLFSELGIEPEKIQDQALYVPEERGLSLYGTGNYQYHEKLFHSMLRLEQTGETGSVKFDGTEHVDDPTGCYIVAYDRYTEELAAVDQIAVNEEGSITVTAK